MPPTSTPTTGPPRSTTAARRTGSARSSSPGWNRTPVDTVKLGSEWWTRCNRQRN